MAQHLPDEDGGQTHGRAENAATPLGEPGSTVTPQDYPKGRKDDAVQPGDSRSFEPRANPQPQQGAGDGGLAEAHDLTGPAGDPAEGKR